MPFFGQEIFERAQAKGPLTDAAYVKARDDARRLAGKDGLLAALEQRQARRDDRAEHVAGVADRSRAGRSFRRRRLRHGRRRRHAEHHGADRRQPRPAARPDIHGPRLQRGATASAFGYAFEQATQGAQGAAVPADGGRCRRRRGMRSSQSPVSGAISTRAMRPVSRGCAQRGVAGEVDRVVAGRPATRRPGACRWIRPHAARADRDASTVRSPACRPHRSDSRAALAGFPIARPCPLYEPHPRRTSCNGFPFKVAAHQQQVVAHRGWRKKSPQRERDAAFRSNMPTSGDRRNHPAIRVLAPPPVTANRLAPRRPSRYRFRWLQTQLHRRALAA